MITPKMVKMAGVKTPPKVPKRFLLFVSGAVIFYRIHSTALVAFQTAGAQDLVVQRLVSIHGQAFNLFDDSSEKEISHIINTSRFRQVDGL